MDKLKSEIQRARSQIESTRQKLERMVQDSSVPFSIVIETNSGLKELTAYRRGLECQSSNLALERSPAERSA